MLIVPILVASNFLCYTMVTNESEVRTQMNPSGNSSKQYCQHLLDSVEKKRKLSLKEFGKADLNKHETIENVNQWYNCIAQEIKKKPPTNYVSHLEIQIDENGSIGSIKYNYFSEDAVILDTFFVIKTVKV